MKIEQIYTGCLSEAAYYIESEGESLIIDPLREVEPYIEKAKENNTKIKYILETHFHADFVSGHVELAKKTGAVIVFGPHAKTEFKFKQVEDGEILSVGKIKIKAIHTPGHTIESTCYLLIDEKGKERALFSGDTLFIGDVGRPDLAVKTNLTKEDLAGLLFDSLRNKILPLKNDIIVYPAHGAGSACGKNISKETFDLLGNQKQTNYALNKNLKKEEFIKEVLQGILPPPQYFPKNVELNKTIAKKTIEQIIISGAKPLTIKEFDNEVKKGALILDVRHQKDFVKGFIPGSWFIGIDGGFAPWVGTLIKDIKQKIVIVCPEGREEEVVTRLARVGYDNSVGFLKGSFLSWEKTGRKVDVITQETAEELEEKNKKGINILDVRKSSEYNLGHIESVNNKPLDDLFNHYKEIDKEKKYHIHCAGGYRSVIYISILKSKGYKNLIDVIGGYAAIKRTKIPKTEIFCSNTKN
ncbi:MAG: MBL fold metallo-hydrolase [Bacteroidetes bacterium MED-G21]|nr:MAG: MBL fold metallo-hydrolase [Bacteroidetes bacterium MED-G21]